MADEILRSKHGFGSLSGVAAALEAGKIDAFDILFLDGDTEPKIGWIDKDSNFRLVKSDCVITVDELPKTGIEGKVYIFDDEGYFWNGKEFVNFCKPTDVAGLESRIEALENALGKFNTTIVDLQTEITNAKADIANAKTDIESLKTDVSDLQTEVNDLKTDISDVKEDVSNLNSKVVDLQTEVEKKANTEDVKADIEQVKLDAIDSANKYADGKAEDVLDESKHLFEKVKYEITNTPVGTLVNYREEEIRVMCPTDTQWIRQSVGETGNADMYYMAFKAYAPEGAVSFKEGDRGVIIDEMFTFDSEFAGTDEFGRNYSICWLALASCKDEQWTYFGKNSSTEKYIGWDYVVEWYNADGVVIASDGIRINLTNEDCHNTITPYYINNATNESKKYTDEQISLLLESMTVVEF